MDAPELKPYRDRLDRLDDEIVDRFVERMKIVREIGRRKREHALPVLQSDREAAILRRLAARAGDEYGDAVRRLYAEVFTISRERQQPQPPPPEKATPPAG